MSVILSQPGKMPVTFRQNTPERWQAAFERARRSGVTIYEVGIGRYVVTSATQRHRAYETDGVRCSCPAGYSGDPVCVHRAALRGYLAPKPEPPAQQAYNPDMEALRWAENDLKRAQEDLSRYAAKMERCGDLSERDYQGSLRAQARELDAWDRIQVAKARLAKTVQVAA